MKSKFIADECVPRSLFLEIKKSGFNITLLTDHLDPGASDQEVFDVAQTLKRTIITFDRGFGDIFRFNIADSHGIIIILLNQLTKKDITAIPLAFLRSYTKSFESKLIIINKSKIRIINREVATS